MSIEDINPYMVSGQWAQDTMTHVFSAMKRHQPISVFYSNDWLNDLVKYQQMIEIGCEYGTATKDPRVMQELVDSIFDDMTLLTEELSHRLAERDHDFSQHYIAVRILIQHCLATAKKTLSKMIAP